MPGSADTEERSARAKRGIIVPYDRHHLFYIGKYLLNSQYGTKHPETPPQRHVVTI